MSTTVKPATVEMIRTRDPQAVPFVVTPVPGIPGPKGINSNITVSATPPTNPSINDIWIDIS